MVIGCPLHKKIETVEDVSILHKFQTDRSRLDLELEKLTLLRKSVTFKINIDNLRGNSKWYQKKWKDSNDTVSTMHNGSKALLKQRREMKKVDTNIKRIGQPELCKTIRAKIAEDIRYCIESEVENRNSYKIAKTNNGPNGG